MPAGSQFLTGGPGGGGQFIPWNSDRVLLAPPSCLVQRNRFAVLGERPHRLGRIGFYE